MRQLFTKLLATKKSFGVAGVLMILAGAYYFFGYRNAALYQFVEVSRGSIAETVSVTGNTVPVRSVSLGFGNSGIVLRVHARVGDRVFAGSILASLETGDLTAQLSQAKAGVAAEVAALEKLKAGARAEDVAASEAALLKGEQDLWNLYASIVDISVDSYAKANDAVRTQLLGFFANGDTGRPQLSFLTSNSQSQVDAENARLLARESLAAWQLNLRTLSPLLAAGELEASIAKGVSRLFDVRNLVEYAGDALNGAVALDATTFASYKTQVASAVSQVNAAVKNLNTVAQSIASQKAAVAQLKAQLDLKKAGPTDQEVAVQEAKLLQARAGVEGIEARIRNSIIATPQSGVVTRLDVKEGETVSALAQVASVISDSAFEIEAMIPETDIGKVAVGNTVAMTVDAFPGETFSGRVTYVDPAQTNTDGVVGYKAKAAFNAADVRMKSGLTVNLDIETRRKENALLLPQHAIAQNDREAFVETLRDGRVKRALVTLGLQDQKGNVEVLSGVGEGERVIVVGLKKK